MSNPTLKNYNTISLKFIEGNRNYKDTITVLKDHIGLDKHDLLGSGFAGKDSIHILLANKETYNWVIDHHNENIFDINNETKIKLIDISSYKIKVSMKNIPFALPNNTLLKILERHGEVDSVKYCHHPTKEGEEFLSGLQSMERIAFMKSITTPIPSTYYLNISQSYIYFSHPNQNTTCTKCGNTDHHGGECPVFKTTAPWKRDNVMNLTSTEFPELPKPRSWYKKNIMMPTTSIVNTLNYEEVSNLDSLDFSQLQCTSEVTLHNETTATATPQSTMVINHRYPSYYLKNPTDASNVTIDKKLTLEKNVSNAHTLVKIQPNAVPVNTNKEPILEINHFNANIHEKSPNNAVNVATDQVHTPEKNHLNANTQEKSLTNTVNITTDQVPTLEKHPFNANTQEKSHINAENVNTSQVPTLEENLLKKPKYDPNLILVTNQIDKLTLDTNPENAANELQHTNSSYSPPNLRHTNARKPHTNV